MRTEGHLSVKTGERRRSGISADRIGDTGGHCPGKFGYIFKSVLTTKQNGTG